jgi:RNA polymerase sigma factor for flagellar operon FliA
MRAAAALAASADELTQQEQDELIRDHMPYAKWVANSWVRNHHAPWSELEEIEGYAFEGLVDAARRYRRGFGAKFITYASIRIRGRILDRLRLDWQHGNPRGLNPETIHWAPMSLDSVLMIAHDGDEPLTFLDLVGNDDSYSPEVILASDWDAEELAQVWPQLRARERFVLERYYWAGLCLAAIGEEMGVTESRACQLHRKALDRLRVLLLERQGETDAEEARDDRGPDPPLHPAA